MGNMEKLSKSFAFPHIMRSAGIKNWPNANVPITAQINEFIPQICKLPYDYLYRDDPVSMAECSLLVWEYLDLDGISANLDVYNFDAQSAGVSIKFFKDHIPDFDRENYFIKDENDFKKIKFGGRHSGRVQYLVDYYGAVSNYIGIDQFPGVSAPWTLACNMYGVENLILEAMTNPEFVYELLHAIAFDLLIPEVRAYKELFSAEPSLAMADAMCMTPMITPDIAEEFIKPLVKEMRENLADIMPPENVMDLCWPAVACLNDSDKKRFLEFFAEVTGGFMFTSVAADLDQLGVEYFREFADEHKMPLSVGIATRYLKEAKPEEIVEVVKDRILTAKDGKTPCLFFFDNIAPFTPIENIKAAVAAVQTYGSVGANADTPFHMPEVEQTFEDFLKYKLENNIEGYLFRWLQKSEYHYLLES